MISRATSAGVLEQIQASRRHIVVLQRQIEFFVEHGHHLRSDDLDVTSQAVAQLNERIVELQRRLDAARRALAGPRDAVARDRNRPLKHVRRADIVLATAEGLETEAFMRRTVESKTCVWLW